MSGSRPERIATQTVDVRGAACSETDLVSFQLDRHNCSTNGLNVYYQNVGGMNSTANDYLLACSDCCYDVIALTETWLDDRTISSQVFGSDYEVFRCDRSHLNSRKKTGGGVLLAIKRELKARILENQLWVSAEQVWVAIKLVNHTLFFCVVYFPPDRIRDPALIDSHMQSVTMVTNQASPKDEVVVFGDYNLPGVKWRQTHNGFLHTDPDRSTFPARTYDLLDSYSTATLQQINSVCNENDRILDLCFVSTQDYAPSITKAITPLVKLVSHHPPLHLFLDNRTANDFHNVVAPVSYNFKKADYNSIINVLLSIDWDDTLDKDNVDAATQTFSHILSYIIDRHVPKKIHSTSRHPPWQTAALRRLKTAKKAVLKKYSRHRTLPLRDHYLKLNHEYKKMSQHCFNTHQYNTQRKLKADPKKFWKYVNEQRKECGLPSSMNLNSEVGTNTQEICRLFSVKFASTFSSESLSYEQIMMAASNVPSYGQTISSIHIDDSSISTAISKLKSSCCPGPDGIPSILLKECITGLLIPLRHIFRLSLSTGIYPSIWKNANMFPVHKKGDKRNIDNYRGISALCATSKLFEIIVMEPVLFHCKQYIFDSQHGYMPMRSTMTNLLSFTTYVTDGMVAGTQTDTIYTDLSAAFDKLNHEIAIAKFVKLGFTGTLLTWFQSYLAGRHICVKIGDNLSDSFSASSGIPQGSHLGPLIFLLYFNDINFSLQGPRLSYADDLKIFQRVDNLRDAISLQGQLNIFANWCDVNRMVLNPLKCSVVSFSRKQNPITFEYQLSDAVIPRVDHVKDLGVILDAKLTFKQHISYIVSKASRQLGFIFRVAKNFKDIYCLKALYCSLVRSSLEYCSTVWNPHYQNGAERIEAVQRRFIRFALRQLPWRDSFRLPSYGSRCQLIHLDTLSTRRDVARALLVSDVLTSRIDCPAILQNINLQARGRILRNNTSLRIPFRRTNYSANGAIIGLQRAFNRVASAFDFNLARETIKKKFYSLLNV